ncbi:hypothetical protein LGN18_17040 [Burkholderia vietnamiensis]|nr:hypothetical protein [Burkholderia vietnamiensis]
MDEPKAGVQMMASSTTALGCTSAVGDHGHQRCVQNYIVGPGSANLRRSTVPDGSLTICECAPTSSRRRLHFR